MWGGGMEGMGQGKGRWYLERRGGGGGHSE